MVRPLRIEFAGALYHVTSRGNAQQDIYDTDADRKRFLALLVNTCQRYNWNCHAYCIMSNHYHLLLETNSATLSKGMKYLNGTYTQYYNRQNMRVGHLFQGRYKAILVQKESYLQELSRYIVLNPVRARMVRSASEWPWSSYRATAGMVRADACLTIDWLLSQFSMKRKIAQERYRVFVSEGKNQASPWESLKNQIYLGSETFVEDMQCKISPEQSLVDIPAKQKLAPLKPLNYYQERYGTRDEAMAKAYLSGHFTLAEIGRCFGVSYVTVSRSVKKLEMS